MTRLIIIAAIVLLIVLLLLMPVGFRAAYQKELKAVLRIGFVSVPVYPPKPKKKKKKQKEKSPEQTKQKDKQPAKKKPGIIKEKGMAWLIDTLRRAAALAAGALKSFFKHLIIRRLNISISYHGENADDTAVKYGMLCLAVYPAVSILVRTADCKRYGVDISPNFNDGETSQYAVDIDLYIRVVWVLGLVLRYGFRALRLLLSLKSGKKTGADKQTQTATEQEPFSEGEHTMEHPIGNLMNITMDKIKEMVDVNTIVGTPITSVDGTLIIPVSKGSYGFASGGSDFPTKNENKDLFGGGSGAGVTIQPIAFLTVYQGNVRLISVGTGDGLDRLMNMVPDVVDKVKGFFKKDKQTDPEVSDDFSEITIDDIDI